MGEGERVPLLQEELIAIEDPVLVARYNECLDELGVRPTSRAAFRIDCRGWSPEVAEELGADYLSAGIGNPFAIVLMPAQRSIPCAEDLYSFERALVDAYFSEFERSIVDITTSRGIAIELDLGFTNLRYASDLRLIRSIIVRTFAGQVAEAGLEQRRLVREFMRDGSGWLDDEMREALRASAVRFGDLRFRNVDIPEFKFEELEAFHTRAFGGVFVLPSRPGGDRFLVFESREQRDASSPAHCFVGDGALTSRLFDAELVELDLHYYLSRPGLLEWKRELILAQLLCESDPELRYFELTVPQRKQRLAEVRDRIPSIVYELEKLMKDSRPPSESQLSDQLVLALLRPNAQRSAVCRAVVLRLLAILNSYDFVQLFAADRARFFSKARTWPYAKQELASGLCRGGDYLTSMELETP